MMLNELKIRVFISRLFMHKSFVELSEQFGISRYSASYYYREVLYGLYNATNRHGADVKIRIKERYVYDNLKEFL